MDDGKHAKRPRGGHQQQRHIRSETKCSEQCMDVGGYSPAAFKLLEMWAWCELSEGTLVNHNMNVF